MLVASLNGMRIDTSIEKRGPETEYLSPKCSIEKFTAQAAARVVGGVFQPRRLGRH
jgi:hypothetical protein